jgi:hypothetical protein
MGASTPAATTRHETLRRLEELLKVLIGRHGARMTLAELLAITAAMARMCERERVSVAEIAAVTGLPKQSL